MATLISHPAGRCARRSPDSNWVDPLPNRGLIEMRVEDDLMHFCWKDKNTGAVEDDLIIFPGEATFESVEQDATKRVHILKFNSSDQKYFFWFQRPDQSNDHQVKWDVNWLLEDPSYVPRSREPPEGPYNASEAIDEDNDDDEDLSPPGAPRLSEPPLAPSMMTMGAGTPAHNPNNTGVFQRRVSSSSGSIPMPTPPPAVTGITSAAASAAASNPEGSAPGTEEMARLLTEWAAAGGLTFAQSGTHQPSAYAGTSDENIHLTNLLSSGNINTLVQSNQAFRNTLRGLLPPGLDVSENPSAEELMPIMNAPQWNEAIGSLEGALRNGGLPGGMMREIGLPESAGLGVGAFVEALRGLRRDGGDGTAEGGQGGAEDDRMETD